MYGGVVTKNFFIFSFYYTRHSNLKSLNYPPLNTKSGKWWIVQLIFFSIVSSILVALFIFTPLLFVLYIKQVAFDSNLSPTPC